MFKLIINNFKRTNSCILLATPMVLFMFLTVLYTQFIITHARTINLLLFSFFTLLVMISGFLAGWFYMVKKTLKLSDRCFVYENDRVETLKNLMMTLPNGVGKFFMPFLGMVLISIGLSIFVYFGIINFFPITKLQPLTDFLTLRSNDETLFVLIYTFLAFFEMLWIPEIIYSERNSVKALGKSLVKTFKTFPKTLFLYLYIFVIYCLTNLSTLFIHMNIALIFLMLVLYYYFVLYSVILVFTYYEQTFCRNED